ncbi:STAS domain-containing protein [Cellulomonas palmilytica]|nr:STAS domain-containing protein [Cellulomonas palmilytica]
MSDLSGNIRCVRGVEQVSASVAHACDRRRGRSDGGAAASAYSRSGRDRGRRREDLALGADDGRGDDVVAAGEIRVEAEPGLTVVRMVGEIDVALREQASSSMVAALTGDGAIVVDASDVTFIDSSGLAFVMQLLRAAREAGIAVSLRDPSRAVRDVLEIVGAASLLPESDDEVAAPVG